MKQKIFITVAYPGLGKATALLFAEKDWKAYPSMRKPENEKELNIHENIRKEERIILPPEQIAAVFYEAAADCKNKLLYAAATDAPVLYAQHLSIGDEAFREGIKQQFFNN